MAFSVSTLSNPFPDEFGLNAPNFNIEVQNAPVPLGVRQLVKSVQYESADGMADLMRIIFQDPKMIQPGGAGAIGSISGTGSAGGGAGSLDSLRDTKLFQPGNEIGLWLGYGTTIGYVGRALIRKVHANFPRAEIPSLEVVAYTRDVVMMDHAPEKSKKVKGKGGRNFPNDTYADAVRQRAADYGFTPDVDDTHDAKHKFMQKVGLSDYDFVNGLANITGFYFWVDGDAEGKWTLHFKDPDTLRAVDLQEKTYTFNYDRVPEGATLLEFQPELAVSGSTTKLQVTTKHASTGRTLSASFEEENDDSPDTLVAMKSQSTLKPNDNKLEGSWTTAGDIKLILNDFSFEVNSNRRFQTEAELVAWAKQWFRRNRENFVLSNGIIIGVEKIMARQTHKLDGLGGGYDGEYYFSNVSHNMDSENGYELDCTMRKSVPKLA